jgi:CTP synthase (UTP-ammonia lyase)
LNQLLNIGIVGDFNPDYPSHTATNEALQHAARALSVKIEHVWIPTEVIEEDITLLAKYDAYWCSPGSPYKSMTGALRSIQYARKGGHPFIGT